jgi:LysR family transcriptional regulator, hydrogen peroxide-inducible genes activator
LETENPLALVERLPTLTQLRHFLAVAEHGHFGKAAEVSLVTQSTISSSIKELEANLGVSLFERTNRSVRLTPFGKEARTRAQAILRDTSDLVDLAGASSEPLSSPLRLGVIPTIAPFLLPRVLPSLRRHYPNLKLYLREDKSAHIMKALGDGDLDLILLAYPYPTSTFETHIFADDPFWVAFPRDHSFKQKERITLRDLKSQSLLLLEAGNCLRDQILASGANISSSEYEATTLHTLVQMVDNKLGVTLLPKMALDAGLIKGTRLEVRPMEGRGAARDIGFAWRKASPRTSDFSRLASFFRDELATPLPKRRQKR